MFKINRYVIYTLIFLLFVSFTGCAGLQRKFVRKKKKDEEKPAPVITMYDYSKELRVDELYKKHFLFWKSWHGELLYRLDSSYKKRASCYDYTVESMLEMKKYLAQAKQEELDKYIKEVKSIGPDIRKKSLTKSELYQMKVLLEKVRREVEKKFSYSDVKDFLQINK